MSKPTHIEVLLAEYPDSRIPASFVHLLEYENSSYVAMKTEPDDYVILKFVEVDGTPQLHDIRDDDEFEAVNRLLQAKLFES